MMRVSIVAMDKGLYNMPKGFIPMLNFLSASILPMLSAKHEPASSRLFLWLILYLPVGSSVSVLKRIIVLMSVDFRNYNHKNSQLH